MITKSSDIKVRHKSKIYVSTFKITFVCVFVYLFVLLIFGFVFVEKHTN